MSADIMSALPLSTGKPTRRVREMLPRTRGKAIRSRDLARAAREAETAIDERRAEEPLRRYDPAQRAPRIAKRGLEASRGEEGT